jgi:hypothetical protein
LKAKKGSAKRKFVVSVTTATMNKDTFSVVVLLEFSLAFANDNNTMMAQLPIADC